MSNPSTASDARSRAWVEVDLGALLRNLNRVRAAVGPDTALLPMVKANAYGLGVERVVQALAGEKPWGLGVAAVAEAEELRALGWTGRVVVFSPVPPGEYARAAAADAALALSETAAVERWAAAARGAGRRLAFHAEVDTGMGRAGFPWHRAGEWGPRVAALSGDLLEWDGCFTHFHSADEPDLRPTDEQFRRFGEALAALPLDEGGGPRRVLHSSNSAAALRRGGYHGDLARPGIFLYGGAAGPGTAPEAVASLRARLGLVREVEPGTTCGYGATYAARGRERWGTLAIGYGDGLRRALSPGGGEALVRGQRVPIIGRISMDATVVDLTAVPGAEAGDVATLIGKDGAEEITVDEVAARVGTISYEVLTGLGTRLPRVYTG